MRITIVTPLYPPDLGQLPCYVKELATRLHPAHHVTVMTYGTIPEEIPGVSFCVVSKNLPIPLRVFAFAVRLWWVSRSSDVLYVSDGASVGWPAIVVGFLWRIPVIRFVMTDEVWERALPMKATSPAVADYDEIIDNKLEMVRSLQRWVLSRATQVIVPTKALRDFCIQKNAVTKGRLHLFSYPPERPERFPLSIEPTPDTRSEQAVETGWNEHLTHLLALLTV